MSILFFAKGYVLFYRPTNQPNIQKKQQENLDTEENHQNTRRRKPSNKDTHMDDFKKSTIGPGGSRNELNGRQQKNDINIIEFKANDRLTTDIKKCF